MKNLKETIELMNSKDYKERFLAEYWQTKLRYEILKRIIVKWEAIYKMDCSEEERKLKLKELLDFYPGINLDLIYEQLEIMGKYLHCLEIRSVLEGINLEQK